MILIDTSIWVDHFARTDARLVLLISENRIVQHPFVTGEVLVGNPQGREALTWSLRMLPPIAPVSDDEFHAFLEIKQLWGTGLGFVDIHLIASASANPGTQIWTRDKRLMAQAERLNLSFQP